MPETETVVAPRTYYSRSQGLSLHPAKGTRVQVNGEMERIGEKIVEFQAIGGDPRYGEYGSYTTDDPEIIEFMEKRCAIPSSDVMTVETYNDQLLPAAAKIEALQSENAQQSRTIAEQNRLIADLQRGAVSGKSKTQ